MPASTLDESTCSSRLRRPAHTFLLPEYADFYSAPDREPLALVARDQFGLAGYWLVHFEQDRRFGVPMYTAMTRVLLSLGFAHQAVATYVVDLTAPLDEIERRVNKAAMRGVRSPERAALVVESATTGGRGRRVSPCSGRGARSGRIGLAPPGGLR